MSNLTTYTETLRAGTSLTTVEAEAAARVLPDAGVSKESKKAFLAALARKGETVEEVAAFARVFRELARDPGMAEIASHAVDVVGTGGDRFGSYNISTTAAIILAADGVPVLKHGNRAITSQCGSAEFLTTLGIDIHAPPEVLRASVEELHFCFFFAPAFHPAFKEMMPVRQELAQEGVGTVFNILGPLINPAQPAHQLLGVFAESWVAPLAGVLQDLGLSRALVVHGRLSEGTSGLDELTLAGDNVLHGVGSLHGFQKVVSPEVFGMETCQPEVLKGGSAEQNRALLEELLSGTAHPGLEGTVCLNAAAAYFAVGRVEDLESGMHRAREVLRGGGLREWLSKAAAFYQQQGGA